MITPCQFKINDILITRHNFEWIHFLNTQEKVDSFKKCSLYHIITPNSEINANYLYHYLTSDRAAKYMKRFSNTYNRIHEDSLKQMPIPLIPLNKQLQIKDILNEIADSIDKCNQIIDGYLRIKKGIIQQIYINNL